MDASCAGADAFNSRTGPVTGGDGFSGEGQGDMSSSTSNKNLCTTSVSSNATHSLLVSRENT